jgi:glycosyltransferase involved in cell wall biosynthesis
VIQLLRECPPGYGGVERVAHELAVALTAKGDSVTTFSLRAASGGGIGQRESDPLPVNYPRSRLAALCLGKLLVVLPSRRLWQLLTSFEPLLLHLPCPMVLAVGMLARLLQPRRRICVYWHAFLDSERWPVAALLARYEGLALFWMRAAQVNVLTTSSVLADGLREERIAAVRIAVLPCCLPETTEQLCLQHRSSQLALPRPAAEGIRLVFVGRLGTYKRVDLLLRAFAGSAAAELHIIGAGDTTEIDGLIMQYVPAHQRVVVHGRLDERRKVAVLAGCDVLLLPSYRSNEAFGIVQLEAMACGLAVCAPQIRRSGLGWVGSLDLLGCSSEPVEAMRAAIAILSCPETLKQCRERCFARYQKLFVREVWLANLEACLDRISG